MLELTQRAEHMLRLGCSTQAGPSCRVCQCAWPTCACEASRLQQYKLAPRFQMTLFPQMINSTRGNLQARRLSVGDHKDLLWPGCRQRRVHSRRGALAALSMNALAFPMNFMIAWFCLEIAATPYAAGCGTVFSICRGHWVSVAQRAINGSSNRMLVCDWNDGGGGPDNRGEARHVVFKSLTTTENLECWTLTSRSHGARPRPHLDAFGLMKQHQNGRLICTGALKHLGHGLHITAHQHRGTAGARGEVT